MASESHTKTSKNSYGLMAFGSSDAWELTIDESLDKDNKWEVEIEGPNIYISFSLKDLKIMRDALDYLQYRILSRQQPLSTRSTPQDGLTLGKFGASKLMLIWDNENFDRCFLIIGPTGNSTVRLSLFGDDIKMLSKAFQKVVDQLPDNLSDP